MPRVKVTRNYQVTIPQEIRERVGLREGDYLEVSLDDRGRIVMEKVRPTRRTLRAGRRLTPEEIERLVEAGMREALP